MYKSLAGPAMGREAIVLDPVSLFTVSDLHSSIATSRRSASFISTSDFSISPSISSSFDTSLIPYLEDLDLGSAAEAAMNSTTNLLKLGTAGAPYIFFMAGPTPEYWVNFDKITHVLPPSSTVKTSWHAWFLPTLSILTIIALIIPFTLHLQLRNTGAWNLILVLLISNTITTVNTLVWPNSDFRNWFNGVGLCDIEVKVMAALVPALASCTLCIIRSLCHVLDIDRCSINPSRSMKRREVWTDLIICWGVPIFIMVTSYIVQPNRYVIVELKGCVDTYATTWPTIVFVYIWPILFVFGTTWYTILTLHRLRLHRHSISSLLSLASLPTSRFLRLFLLSTCILLIYLPTEIYYFTLNLSYSLHPFSWSQVHSGGNIKGQASWNSVGYTVVGGPWLLDAYIGVAQAGLVFLFFGLGSEAKRKYRRIAIALNLHKLFPSMGREEGRRQKTWVTRLSPIRLMRRKFDHWIGQQTQESEANNWNSRMEMLRSGRSEPGTQMTGSTCKSRKESAAAIEYATPAHPAAVLGNSREDGWMADGVELRNIGVLHAVGVSQGRRPSEFGHSQTTTLDCRDRDSTQPTRSWLSRLLHRPSPATFSSINSSTRLSSTRPFRQRTTADTDMDLEITGARNRGESVTHTQIWSGQRNSIGDMNGRYGRLDSVDSESSNRPERSDEEVQEGVRVHKVVGVVREVAVAK